MITQIKCPDYAPLDKTKVRIFLAGGITGCPGWQEEFADKYIKNMGNINEDIVLINPRRDDFDANNPSMAVEQIAWEYAHLNISDIVLFWFPCETLCPITLFELGKMSERMIPIFVGTHPDYKRRDDVVIQMALSRPEINVVDNLDDLVDQIACMENTY